MKANMESIERAAAQKYKEQDAGGEWTLHESTGYYYNALHRWYYDTKSRMYYGGTPPAWTSAPSIPASALWNERAAPQDPLLAGLGVSKYPKGMKVGVIDHPLAGVGGYQMPTSGDFRIGEVVGGEGDASRGKGAHGVASGGVKKFTERGDKPLTKRQKEELEFQKKREAARRRVEKRTKQQFGLA